MALRRYGEGVRRPFCDAPVMRGGQKARTERYSHHPPLREGRSPTPHDTERPQSTTAPRTARPPGASVRRRAGGPDSRARGRTGGWDRSRGVRRARPRASQQPGTGRTARGATVAGREERKCRRALAFCCLAGSDFRERSRFPKKILNLRY